MGRRILQVAAGVVLGLAVALLMLPLLPSPPADEARNPHLLPDPYPAPEARLVDEHGEPAALPGDFDGVTVVFFGYSHCPDVCPATMAALATARERLKPPLAERFRAVMVTVDPARDTPERLEEYLARFDTAFQGRTGTEEEIRAAAEAWGAWAARAQEEDESGDAADDPHAAHGGEGASPTERGYLVDHTARAFLVDPESRIVGTFPASTPPDAMLPTLRELLEEDG